MALDVAAAQAAMARLGAAMGVEARAAAEGVLAVANEQIAAAIRLISVNRGLPNIAGRLIGMFEEKFQTPCRSG